MSYLSFNVTFITPRPFWAFHSLMLTYWYFLLGVCFLFTYSNKLKKIQQNPWRCIGFLCWKAGSCIVFLHTSAKELFRKHADNVLWTLRPAFGQQRFVWCFEHSLSGCLVAPERTCLPHFSSRLNNMSVSDSPLPSSKPAAAALRLVKPTFLSVYLVALLSSQWVIRSQAVWPHLHH